MSVDCDAEDCKYNGGCFVCDIESPTIRKVEVHGFEFSRCIDYSPE